MANENGIGQYFIISDDKIMKGTQGEAADLAKQSEIYFKEVKGSLPDNEYTDESTYLDQHGGGDLLDKSKN